RPVRRGRGGVGRDFEVRIALPGLFEHAFLTCVQRNIPRRVPLSRGGHGLLSTGTLFLGRGLPVALLQAGHYHIRVEFLFTVVVELDDDPLITAGHDGAEAELEMLDLRTLGIRVGGHGCYALLLGWIAGVAGYGTIRDKSIGQNYHSESYL